ncbi:MAG TPA: HAMP domain-containing sensor histidine kinase [Anaerolineales bacterium]|jgi:signal transduction histidine kinase|nr:HAMP domain-containing sensor histidine kinase [Anaerolineales bacterium]
MSLRARLTLLYTTLLGGILLAFGLAVYGLVSVILVDQIDANLIQTFYTILRDINQKPEVETMGNLNGISLPSLDITGNVAAQAWSRNGTLLSSNTQLGQPLDPTELQSPIPVFHDVVTQGVHLRVFTIPLELGGRPIGTIQLGASLQVVDATQATLVTVLVVGAIISMTLAGLAGWLSTRRALAPLEAVTNTALQITRADDLSRRILYQGPANDEVGQLIHAFNQTLSRLENLFDTQRRFIADVGHELRTPLTVIKGNVDLMRRMGYSDDESLEGIENEVDRLTRLVGDLLLLAQAESGKLPLDQRLVELDTLVLEAMQQMRVLARDRLNLHLGDIDQVLVCGDRDRLKQVLVNLIGNAIKYTPKGGEVVVGLGKVDNQAQLTVRDTGPGIPEGDLPYIFERFYRGEKSRTRSRDGKGFGLGLSIAYWIVRNHNGRIEVSSKLEQGTTFCVWLPLAAENCPPR